MYSGVIAAGEVLVGVKTVRMTVSTCREDPSRHQKTIGTIADQVSDWNNNQTELPRESAVFPQELSP